MGWRAAVIEYTNLQNYNKIRAFIQKYNNHYIYLGTVTINNKHYVKFECDSQLFMNICQQQFTVIALENMLTVDTSSGLKIVGAVY